MLEVEMSQLLQEIEALRQPMKELNDFIFDHPELGNEEFQAHELLTNLLEKEGFTVDREVSGLKTAFRAVYHVNSGGPKIGLLCEYDALEGLGHACGHNLQGPSICTAAIALKRTLHAPCTLVVYGTPAEETASGKLVMAREGVFDDLDLAFMMHGSDTTTVDGKSLALNLVNIKFHGKSAHAAIAPEKGALDAVLLFFNGMEYLREHVPTEVRMHGIITDGGKAANIVPDYACTQWYIRSSSRIRLDEIVDRVKSVAQGAALQVGATMEWEEVKAYDNKVNVQTLNDILLKNAEKVGAPEISEPRKVTGSTDFSSVTFRVPGACLRVKFVGKGVTSHSQEWLDNGKSQLAEDAIMYGAKGIALSVEEILETPGLLEKIKEDFKQAKENF